MRLCNSRILEEHLVCYQTSQRNWVVIKVLYRCLQRYLLSWHISRLGFVTPIVGEVSLGPLGNAHKLGKPMENQKREPEVEICSEDYIILDDTDTESDANDDSDDDYVDEAGVDIMESSIDQNF